MTLDEMICYIQVNLKNVCIGDIHRATGISYNTLDRWAIEPPERPSLHVFCRLAYCFGLNPTLKQLGPLL